MAEKAEGSGLVCDDVHTPDGTSPTPPPENEDEQEVHDAKPDRGSKKPKAASQPDQAHKAGKSGSSSASKEAPQPDQYVHDADRTEGSSLAFEQAPKRDQRVHDADKSGSSPTPEEALQSDEQDYDADSSGGTSPSSSPVPEPEEAHRRERAMPPRPPTPYLPPIGDLRLSPYEQRPGTDDDDPVEEQPDDAENVEGGAEGGAVGGRDGDEEEEGEEEHELPFCPLSPDQIELALRILRWRYRKFPERETLVVRLLNYSLNPPPYVSPELLYRLERGQPTFDFYVCQSDDGPANPSHLDMSVQERDTLDRVRVWLYRLVCAYHDLNPDNPLEPELHRDWSGPSR